AEAGTEALGLRRGCVREPAYVVRLGPGRAGRQAVDARGHDAGDRMLVELVAGGRHVHATSGVVTVNRERGAWPAMTSGRARRKRGSPATALRTFSLTRISEPRARSPMRDATLTACPTRSPSRVRARPVWIPMRSGTRAARCIASAATTASAGDENTTIT